MRKLLLFTVLLALIAIPIKAQDILAEKTFLFGGVNYEGNFGGFVGIGHTIGKVSVLPYYRFSIDSTLQDDIRFKRTAGVETTIWIYEKPKFKVGIMASVLNVDWLENQDQSIGVYWSQGAGGQFHWQIMEQVGLNGWLKAKGQLLDKDTSYKDVLTFGLAVDVLKFW